MVEIFHEEGYNHLNPAHLNAISKATFSTPPDYHYRIKVAFLSLQKVCTEVFSPDNEIDTNPIRKEFEQNKALENTKLGYLITDKILPCINPEYLMDWYDFIYKRPIENTNIEYIQNGFESVYDTLNDFLVKYFLEC